MKTHKVKKLHPKRDFIKKGTCSRAFFHILNREFGHIKENEEIATDLLAGGIKQLGYQCGMIWGASMAIGAEAYRRYGYTNEAILKTNQITQDLMDSFVEITGSIECEEITETDFTSKWGLAKYLLTGKAFDCFRMSDKWGPVAVKIAQENFDKEFHESDEDINSCTIELMNQLNCSDEEKLMVSAFAGGLGLKGSGCGALAAAIWKFSLEKYIETNKRPSMPDPVTDKLLESFYEASDYKMECTEICGRKFQNLKEHTDYINGGGCSHIIKKLSAEMIN